MRIKPLLFTLLLFPLLFSGLVSSPAAARAVKPSVSITMSAATVQLGNKVQISGIVSKASSGAIVRLQRQNGKHWRNVQKSRVNRDRTYTFSYAIAPGQHKLRVKVEKNKKIKAAFSRTRVVTGLTTPASPTQPHGTSAEISQVVATLLQKHNNYRSSKGLAPLTLKPAITAIAQNWAAHMASQMDYRHNPTYYVNYPAGWLAAGENIGTIYEPDDVFQAWVNSPGHRANIETNYTHIGIGFARGEPEEPGDAYYVVNFATYH
jgi:uncharacterized protein YkwD